MLTHDIGMVMQEVYRDRLREAEMERRAREVRRRGRPVGWLRPWLLVVLAAVLGRRA